MPHLLENFNPVPTRSRLRHSIRKPLPHPSTTDLETDHKCSAAQRRSTQLPPRANSIIPVPLIHDSDAISCRLHRYAGIKDIGFV